jgi:hypothetical protein
VGEIRCRKLGDVRRSHRRIVLRQTSERARKSLFTRPKAPPHKESATLRR